jgi:putative pyruvate formate lyase activating enzyme
MTGPAYAGLIETGELKERAKAAHALRTGDECRLCPRQCCADREGGSRGECGLMDDAVLAYAAPFYADEPCLTGEHGSGAVFFAGCNLRCRTCRNADISHEPDIWRRAEAEDLASYMLSLQARNVANLNLVTPSHVIPEVLDALVIAAERGLTLPIVYNTHAYDRVETLRLLDGIVDVYLPDFKFWDPDTAEELAAAPDYPEVARDAIREMHRQVGDLVFDADGLARRGLLVRHLVLPGDRGGARKIAKFLAREISKDTCVNIMGTYTPPPALADDELLSRRPTREEVLAARNAATDAGLRLVDLSGI